MHPPQLEVELEDDRVQGVTAVVQNGSPYTYFGERPVHLGEGADLESGDLAGIVLQRARPIDIPTIAWRALSPRARVARHRHIHPFTGLAELHIRSCDDRPLPLQVDGDYIGEAPEATFSVIPRGITVIS